LLRAILLLIILKLILLSIILFSLILPSIILLIGILPRIIVILECVILLNISAPEYYSSEKCRYAQCLSTKILEPRQPDMFPGLVSSGTNIIKLFTPAFMNVRNKLDRLLRAGLSSLV
jgi:hypothetical protein